MACISFEHIKYLLEQLDIKSSYKYINPATHGILKVKGLLVILSLILHQVIRGRFHILI